MQVSTAVLALALAVGIVNAVSISKTASSHSGKFAVARLQARLRHRRPELKKRFHGKPHGAASILAGRMLRKPLLRMPTLARQTELPIDGDGVYDTCSTDGELELLDDTLPCLACLLEDEECPTDCCANFATDDVDSNQAILCEVGSCCIRIMVNVDSDAVVYSNEPFVAASKARGDNTCRDWETSRSCRSCSLVSPDFAEEETLTCPYEMPRYEAIWDANLECAGGAEGVVSDEVSPAGDGDDVPAGESTGVPSVDDVRCKCECESV